MMLIRKLKGALIVMSRKLVGIVALLAVLSVGAFVYLQPTNSTQVLGDVVDFTEELPSRMVMVDGSTGEKRETSKEAIIDSVWSQLSSVEMKVQEERKLGFTYSLRLYDDSEILVEVLGPGRIRVGEKEYTMQGELPFQLEEIFQTISQGE